MIWKKLLEIITALGTVFLYIETDKDSLGNTINEEWFKCCISAVNRELVKSIIWVFYKDEEQMDNFPFIRC
jgi:hypothetical protein